MNAFIKLFVLAALSLGTMGAHAGSFAVGNSSFEAPWQSVALTGRDRNVTFYYQPTGPDIIWSFGTGTGLAPAYSLLTAYDGQWFALLQGETGILSQSFTIAQDIDASLSFALALRAGYATGQIVQVSLDGQALTTFHPTAPTWVLETQSLGLLTAGQHTIAFRGLSGNVGDTTAFIDEVQISAVPEPAISSMLLPGLAAFGIAAIRREGEQRRPPVLLPVDALMRDRAPIVAP